MNPAGIACCAIAGAIFVYLACEIAKDKASQMLNEAYARGVFDLAADLGLHPDMPPAAMNVYSLP